MKIRTFRIAAGATRASSASPRAVLCIATTRRPPRGVPKARWQKDGYFDVWLPTVAPSASLLSRTRRWDFDNPKHRAAFFAAYRREMQSADARQTIALLAALAKRLSIAIGCYCEDESRCHRSVLRNLIESVVRSGEPDMEEIDPAVDTVEKKNHHSSSHR
jgi:uncharacterized protein YeaO (DUF488 family)